MRENEKVEVFSKVLQAVTVTALAINGFFMVRAFGQLDAIAEKVNRHDTQIAVLEERTNGHRQG